MHSLLKTKVVIATTLKPVDDTRLYEKIGLSLADSNHYDVHIIGAPGGKTRHVTNHPIERVRRISLKRIFLPFAILKKIIALRPDLLIIGTHELLFAAAIYKMFYHKVLVYDVQENYYLNIRHTDAFPPIIRPLLASWVRLKERMVSPLIDQFLLAEKGFENELLFTQGKAAVIENKAVVPAGFVRKPNHQYRELLFSGTIDASTGIFEAINLAVALHSNDPNIRLHIIGYCSRPEVLRTVRDAAGKHDFIRITGGDVLQPHSEIMKAIATAHFGIISYWPSPHINNRMPTKLYEYLACRLPILIRKDLWWCDLIEKTKSGISFDISNGRPLLTDQDNFYPGGSRNLSYEFDRNALVSALNQVMERPSNK